VLHREGVHDIKESGTAEGTAQRVWAGLKSRLGGGDHTLLATAEESEDETAAAYDRAMDSYLPLPVRQLLTTQAAHVKLSHDYVRAARDRKG
ncbi:MAG TPA: PA2169 family four-helix-bundle protein, partial [Terracidiphilus sp.]|nr:PA2169 family four-helix-bundle protein [Terracidiphilus sp.]